MRRTIDANAGVAVPGGDEYGIAPSLTALTEASANGTVNDSSADQAVALMCSTETVAGCRTAGSCVLQSWRDASPTCGPDGDVDSSQPWPMP